MRTRELRKSGRLIRLQHQPFKVLALLASHPARLLTREELQREVWGGETFVDFEHGLNFCIKQVRAALGDDAGSPRFVETLPRRGYRFIAPVESVEAGDDTSPPRAPSSAPAGRPLASAGRWRMVALASAVVATAAALAFRSAGGAERAAARPPGRALLAVLPFANIGGASEEDYLADGLTEEMITELGRLQPRSLAVIARSSAMRFKDRLGDMDGVARELGVDYVVEGSVRRGGDRVRIAVKLVQVSDATPLWAETYDRQLSDILAVQKEVAEAVAHRIRLTLTPQERARLAGAGRVDAEAYQLYLRGRFFWNKRDEAGLRKSIGYFEQAIARQPDYVLAHVGVADAYIVLADHSVLPAAEAAPRARAAAQRALELDASSAEAHTSLAMIRAAFDWDWAQAEQLFRRALDLNPGYATAHHWYAHCLRAQGRHEEALAETRRALALDPLSLIINNNVASALFYGGHYEEAVEQYRRTLDMDPYWGPANWGLGRTLLALGRRQEAIASLRRATERSPDPGYRATLGFGYAVSGRPAEARHLLAELHGLAARHYVSPYDLAVVEAGLGERDRALDRLEQAFRERHILMRLIAVDERLAGLRGTPRFEALVRAMGFAKGAQRIASPPAS